MRSSGDNQKDMRRGRLLRRLILGGLLLPSFLLLLAADDGGETRAGTSTASQSCSVSSANGCSWNCGSSPDAGRAGASGPALFFRQCGQSCPAGYYVSRRDCEPMECPNSCLGPGLSGSNKVTCMRIEGPVLTVCSETCPDGYHKTSSTCYQYCDDDACTRWGKNASECEKN